MEERERDRQTAANLKALLETLPERSKCWDCDGKGQKAIGPGAIVNGQFTGKIGVCFRCKGKGYQTHADVTRNYWYDAKYRRIEL